MKINLMRIDDRLIHGQTISGWSHMSNFSRIVVVNDSAAQDSFQTRLLKMASVKGMPVDVLTVSDAYSALTREAWPNDNLMVIFKGPIDVMRLIEMGMEIDEINIGMVRQLPDSIKLSKDVHATVEELKAWNYLDEKNVNIYIQPMPTDPKRSLNEMLAKYKQQ